jgi:two-component system LytT family response regulator
MTVRALIADDEPPARRKLRDLLEPIDWLACVGETADGPGTVQAVDTLHPDLLFLDIRMPGATGLEVLEQLTHMPHVIFTTAYDAYAVTAFELQALDYLLKPFGPKRLHKALDRARRLLESRPSTTPALERARTTLAPQQPITRLFVRERGRILPVSVDEIEYLEAHDDYVMLHTEARKPLVRVRLRDLTAQLDPARFIRVHRSYTVNLDHVVALIPYDAGRLQVVLQSGTKIIASRSGSKRLRQWVL